MASVLVLLLLGGGGLVYNALWYALMIAMALWIVGFSSGVPRRAAVGAAGTAGSSV